MQLESVVLILGVAEPRAVWEVVWWLAMSVAALSFIGLGWLVGRGALVTQERQRHPWLSPVAFLLFWVGLGASVLGLVAAVLST